MSVSVLVLTLNEEVNLPGCLQSLAWSDDIVVLDSFSSDRTVEIAKAAGAKVVQRAFDNWSAHQNWAVCNIQFKNPWVYYSDADERVPPDLAQEIQSVTADAARQEVAYGVRFRNMFMGRWIKHSCLYPTWVVRLFRPEKIRWERAVNPVAVIDGPKGLLRCHFEHYSFTKGMTEWFAKHNRYSQQEAEEIMASMGRKLDLLGTISSDPVRRRKAWKQLAYCLPGRPLLMFFYLYFVRLGFLDGRPGLKYCLLRTMYERMIDFKVMELRRRLKGLPM